MWHAEKMKIDKVATSHVWLLTTIADMPNGELKVIHKTRAPSKTPTKEELRSNIEALSNQGVEHVWVTRKYPLLVFLWPALIPLVMLGGPMAYLMPLIGL